MSRKRFGAGVRLVIVPALCLSASAPGPAHPTSGKVTGVHDGDTITVEVGGERFSCRLMGIDAPELPYALLWTEMEKVSKYATLEARRDFHEA